MQVAGSGQSAREDRHVFLFSDLLLLATVVTPNILNRDQMIHLLRDVLLVEQVILEDRPHSFQIKYSEGGQEYTLYIQVRPRSPNMAG